MFQVFRKKFLFCSLKYKSSFTSVSLPCNIFQLNSFNFSLLTCIVVYKNYETFLFRKNFSSLLLSIHGNQSLTNDSLLELENNPNILLNRIGTPNETLCLMLLKGKFTNSYTTPN